MRKWTVAITEHDVVDFFEFPNYESAYNYALTSAFLMFNKYFTCEEITEIFDRQNGFRLGPNVVSLFQNFAGYMPAHLLIVCS